MKARAALAAVFMGFGLLSDGVGAYLSIIPQSAWTAHSHVLIGLRTGDELKAKSTLPDDAETVCVFQIAKHEKVSHEFFDKLSFRIICHLDEKKRCSKITHGVSADKPASGEFFFFQSGFFVGIPIAYKMSDPILSDKCRASSHIMDFHVESISWGVNRTNAAAIHLTFEMIVVGRQQWSASNTLILSTINRSLSGGAGFAKSEGDIKHTNGRNKEHETGNNRHQERPFGHFLLGFQIIFGSLGFAIGVWTLNDTIEDGKKSTISSFHTVSQKLLGCACVVAGYIIALFGVFQMIDLYFPPSIPT